MVADVAAGTVTGHGSDVVLGDHYVVVGSEHDDTLIGDDGDDQLSEGGAERLLSYLPALTWYGTAGPDVVQAAPTADRRTGRLVADGRGGADRILGTTRRDRIDGGPGRDRADGAGGADTCVAVEVRRSC